MERETWNGPVKGFLLAGDDGVFHPSEGRIENAIMILTSSAVASPKAVRYAWANLPAVNLVNGSGLPTAPFRTDAPSEPTP